MQRKSCLRSITKTVNEIDRLLDSPEMSDELDVQLETALRGLVARWAKYEEAQAISLLNLTPSKFDHDSVYLRVSDLHDEFVALRAKKSKAEQLAEEAHREWAKAKENKAQQTSVATASAASYLPITQVTIAAPIQHAAAPNLNVAASNLQLEPKEIGVKLADDITPVLHDSIKMKPHYSSDSTVNQSWIPGEPHHRNEPTDQENPANLCSSEAHNKVNPCWNGSPWLSDPQSSCSGEQESIMEPQNPEPWKDSRAAQNHITQEKGPPLPPLINSTGNYQNENLINIELQVAKMDIIRQDQEEILQTELLTHPNNQRPSRSPPSTGLRPPSNHNDRGIRLLCRSNQSPEEAVDVVVLPAKHHVIKLMKWNAHNRLLYAGIGQTLTDIRRNVWILQGRGGFFL